MKTEHTAGLFLGLAAGAATMYLLDPQRGRRRRAELSQKMARFGNRAGEAMESTSRDAVNRTRGLFAEIASWFSNEPADDRVLRERVRARLGMTVSHPRSIGVVANDGRVTLSGPILAHEVEGVLDEVARVPGVKQVDNHLDVHREPADISGLQGGASKRRRGDQFEFWQENWSPTARALAGAIGTGLFLYGARQRTGPGMALATAGLGLLTRGMTNLDLQRLTGIGAGRRAVEINETIRIAAPVDQVFKYWTNFEQYPRFMNLVRDVRKIGEGRSHWVLEGPGGIPLEWALRVTRYEPSRTLGWKTEPGSGVQHSGLVTFQPDADGGTTVHIRMSYNPVAGALGHAAATVVGYDLKSVVDEEVMRMKQAIESGKVADRDPRGSTMNQSSS